MLKPNTGVRSGISDLHTPGYTKQTRMPPKKPTKEDQQDRDASELQDEIASLQEALQAARITADQATSDRARAVEDAESAEVLVAEERRRAQAAAAAAARAGEECQALKVAAESANQDRARAIEDVGSAEALVAEERHRAQAAAAAATRAEEECQALKVLAEAAKQEAAANQSVQMQRNVEDVVAQWEQQHPHWQPGPATANPVRVPKSTSQPAASVGETGRMPSTMDEQRSSAGDAGTFAYRPSYGGRSRNSPDVPLPRQSLFDGKGSWEAFIRPFDSLARSCGWSEDERLFRLSNSLRGDAAEYAFCQLTPDVLGSYGNLVLALEVRFQERRAVASYLAQLEGRRQQQDEKLSEYIADLRKLVIKGYPTANESTRETIVMHHFLKGLPDRQAAVSVGMTNPTTVEDARTALDTYQSLKDEVSKPPRVRAVQGGEEFVTTTQLHKFGEELKSSVTESMDTKLDEIKSLLKSRPQGQGKRDMTKVECYKCHEHGHYARDCKPKQEGGSATTDEKPENC